MAATHFTNLAIVGLAHLDAPHRVASSDLEEQLAPAFERLGYPRGLFESLAGVRARRFWDAGVEVSQVATQAGELAIADAGIDRSQIGIVISTSVSKDFIEPSVASRVHSRLGLGQHCLNFDISNACLAFLNGIQIAGYMIERGQIEYGLIVCAESSRYAIEQTIERLRRPEVDSLSFRENFATLTLGSGAAAMVVGRADSVGSRHRVTGGVTLAATGNRNNDLCVGNPDQMRTDSMGLMLAGLELARQTYPAFLQAVGLPADAFDLLAIHQVSKPHTERLAAQLSLDIEKIYRIYPEYGNIGPAAIPIALAKAHAEGRIHTGQQVALMGIGSGLNCSMMAVSW